jgi:hypothetical protein
VNGGAPVMARALVRWQHAAGPYWPYVCATPFLDARTPVSSPRRRSTAKPAFLHVLEKALLLNPVAVFADLPVAETLPATAALRQSGSRVVPVIQRWVVPNAVLNCRRLQEALVANAPRATRLNDRWAVVFLLDSERGGSPQMTGRTPRTLFDNRYDYPICRFPPPTLLKRKGITAVYWLTSDGIAPDLLPYTEQLAGAGLTPHELRLPTDQDA